LSKTKSIKDDNIEVNKEDYFFKQLLDGVFSTDNKRISNIRNKKRGKNNNNNIFPNQEESDLLKKKSLNYINFENIQKENNIYINILKEIPNYVNRMKNFEQNIKNKEKIMNSIQEEEISNYLEKNIEYDNRKRTKGISNFYKI